MKKSFFVLFLCLFVNVCLAACRCHSTDNFLVISDIHLNTLTSHKMDIIPSTYDDINDLDSPTFDSMLKTLSQKIQDGTVPSPNFIIILGDLVGHRKNTQVNIFDSENAVFGKLKQFFPHTPILYTFGNNDAFDADYGPFENNSQQSPYNVAKLNAGWVDGFLSTGNMCNATQEFPCVINEDSHNGYYTAYLQPKFRLISLNSSLFSFKRTGVTEKDAQAELQWLDAQLKDAQSQQESVLIAMHIPPGYNIYDHSPFWQSDDLTAFLQIVNQYSANIVGILTSHTHAEELKVIKDKNNKNIGGVFFTAGFSTSHGNMPSVKTFYFVKNNDQWNLSNYDAFRFNQVNDSLSIESLYSYNNYYCNKPDSKNMLDCLQNVSAAKIQTYYMMGNPKYSGTIKSPEDVFLIINH